MKPQKKQRPRLLRVTRSTRAAKKYRAVFDDGTITHFGGKGCGDFIIYSRKSYTLANAKRKAYLARHGATERWTDSTTAASLSRFILWEERTLADAIKRYNNRFR